MERAAAGVRGSGQVPGFALHGLVNSFPVGVHAPVALTLAPPLPRKTRFRLHHDPIRTLAALGQGQCFHRPDRMRSTTPRKGTPFIRNDFAVHSRVNPAGQKSTTGRWRAANGRTL